MRRAAPAFEILMFAPVRRFFPEPRQLLNGSWRCSRVCTPPRISPSCPHYVPLWLGRSIIVRGRDHCEAACQSCFWMDGYRSSPYWAVFMQKQCFPHRWSSRILRIAVPFLAHPLDVIQSLDMYFSSCMGRTENVPSLLVGIKSKVLIGSFQKFFDFFQNSVLTLADRGLFDVHNLCDLTLRLTILISQCQQELLISR